MFRFVANGVEAEEVAARREEVEAPRGAEAAAAAARMAAEKEKLELPWPRERRFGAWRKPFGEHYLDELYRATRNDTLLLGVTDKPPHGWRKMEGAEQGTGG